MVLTNEQKGAIAELVDVAESLAAKDRSLERWATEVRIFLTPEPTEDPAGSSELERNVAQLLRGTERRPALVIERERLEAAWGAFRKAFPPEP